MAVFKLLHYDRKSEENNIYLPNEIFDDLKKAIDISSHIPFAYCYYYLITYLYRFAKYGLETKLTKDVQKSILGYNANYKKIDYIIKKNGVLDQIGYTKDSHKHPIDSYLVKDDGFPYPEFVYNTEMNEEVQKYMHKKLIIKEPVKAFIRNDDNGTFYDISNTHSVPVSIFLYCISNPKLGTTAAYLYGFLKWKNDMFKSGYGRSIMDLSYETGIPVTTLFEYIQKLEEHNLLSIKHSVYIPDLPLEKRRPNVYVTLYPEKHKK